jgi:Phosphodiester glycosidase
MAPMRLHLALGLVAFLWTLPAGQAAPPPRPIAPAVERISDGVELQRLTDPSLLSPAGPVAVHALRLDPRKVALETAVAEDRLPARETVAGIAARRKALAAVNGGFFALENGAPTGLLKVRGTLIGGTRRARGAVAFLERGGRTRLLFDRVIVDRSQKRYAPSLGSAAEDWERAGHAVGGAGLLLRDGRVFDEWSEERIAQGFDTTRHPRTMIGDDGTSIWLVAVDGRQPLLSLGMSFRELQGLAARLGLRSALNLDGGGSTTMVIRGAVVNHPSDQTGPRSVSDAIVVRSRK